MIAAPWYLASLGIVLVIIGLISGVLFGAQGSSRTGIDARMSDAEIARRLKRRSPLSFSGLVFYAGLFCLLASLAWRLLRYFL